MKSFFIFGSVVLLFFAGFSLYADSLTTSYNAKLDSITNRVRAGDYNALNEVANMPASVAVPYLEFWVDERHGRTPQQLEAAGTVLRNVSGYADYIREDMEAITTQGNVPERDFELLKIIDTPEAEAVVAPYLFDLTTITQPHDDVPGDANCAAALYALKNMKLSDAPSDLHQNSEELVAWQKWAITKGYVPKDWSSRVVAPDWLLKLDAMEKTAPGSSTAPTLSSQATHELQHASAIPATPVPSAIAKNNGRGMMWIIAIMAIVIAAGLLLIRGRRRL